MLDFGRVPVGKEHSVMAPNEGPFEAILEVEEKASLYPFKFYTLID